ncbi:MAG TPA: helix-turn-helix domain-containing protein [Pseudosphingobacterium sp.]|nr:helix-turn-helix domain-containing protein [Pseudosphingobacterium sp.]
MEIEVITREDLHKFRIQLLDDIGRMLSELTKPKEEINEWLRSKEVRGLLKISASTLQNMRISGKLPYSKIDGRYYYKQGDIKKLLNGNK